MVTRTLCPSCPLLFPFFEKEVVETKIVSSRKNEFMISEIQQNYFFL